jgi:hypothetical protein
MQRISHSRSNDFERIPLFFSYTNVASQRENEQKEALATGKSYIIVDVANTASRDSK